MTTIKIITLEPKRWEEYRYLRLRSLEIEPTAFGASLEEDVQISAEEWRERLEHAQQRNGAVTLFAEMDGILVGMLGAYWSNRRAKIAHIANVWGVYVEPEMRGQGIAKQLLVKLLEEVRQVPQLEKIRLWVNTEQAAALALYERFGFELVGTVRNELKIGDVYYDEHLMELQLRSI